MSTLIRSTPIAHEVFGVHPDAIQIDGFSVGVHPESQTAVLGISSAAPDEPAAFFALRSKGYALKLARALLEAAEYLPEGS